MKNKLTNLNDTLFEQLERLTADDLKPDQLEIEMKRTAAVVQLAAKIVDNSRLQLDSWRFLVDNGGVDASKLQGMRQLVAGDPNIPTDARK